MHHVIEIVEPFLVNAEGNVGDAGIHISHVMEEDAFDVFTGQREAHLRGMKEQAVAAYREAGGKIARTSLIVGKAAMRSAAAAEKALGQGHVIEGIDSGSHAERMNPAEFGVAGNDGIAGNPFIKRTAAKE